MFGIYARAALHDGVAGALGTVASAAGTLAAVIATDLARAVCVAASAIGVASTESHLREKPTGQLPIGIASWVPV